MGIAVLAECASGARDCNLVGAMSHDRRLFGGEEQLLDRLEHGGHLLDVGNVGLDLSAAELHANFKQSLDAGIDRLSLFARCRVGKRET